MSDAGENRRVYVVDDEQLIATTLALILRKAGYDTKSFFSAEDALQAIANCVPQAVVSDVKMGGMNGVDMALAIRREYPGVFVQLISGQADTSVFLDEAQHRGQKVNIAAKPVRPEALLKMLSDGLVAA